MYSETFFYEMKKRLQGKKIILLAPSVLSFSFLSFSDNIITESHKRFC